MPAPITLQATGSVVGVAPAGGPELSVVVPTRNERGNVGVLVERVAEALQGIRWEIIFVDDDSTDGTVAAVRQLALDDTRVRLLHRIGRRGLSSACIEGIQASTAPFVAVMDGDLQHDEKVLPTMLAALKSDTLDMVVGSRYVAGGGIGDWDKGRARISNIATRLGGLVLRVKIADPMSGFFMLRRDVFDGVVRRLSGIGFKILVDILASSEVPIRLQEVPYQFGLRHAGESKLDSQVAIEYLLLIADKVIGHLIPVRFILFSLVGFVGLAAHLVVLSLSLSVLGFSFPYAQGLATGTAMVGNYTLNNSLTYRDRRLKGWRFIRGLISFALVCGVGAFANVGLSSYLFDSGRSSWWLAGIAGALMSSVWNYAVSSVVTWKR
ncbi:MAG TPA: glycosyltransferase family 2 protein [Stellaceae bacterium]|nr:glycosyltransferase family 2 protein [Stellaceae bacterium]